MKNTANEVAEYTQLLNDLEDKLFDKLKSMRKLADLHVGNTGTVLDKRKLAVKYLDAIQYCKWHLGNNYGFSPTDGTSSAMINEIELYCNEDSNIQATKES